MFGEKTCIMYVYALPLLKKYKTTVVRNFLYKNAFIILF